MTTEEIYRTLIKIVKPHNGYTAQLEAIARWVESDFEVKKQGEKLTIPVVMPSFLTHPYAQVVCTNKGELNYVLEWAKQNGKEVSEHYYKVEKFPYHLFLEGKIVGWTDSTNRIGDKFSFREFVDG